MQEKEAEMQETGIFHYTYSAPEQQEVKKIREKYLPREESKLEQLRRMDEHTTKKGMAVSVMLGTVSTLVLGIGMCCSMVWGGWLFFPGIGIGLVGIAGLGLAYPMYKQVIRRERAKIAPEILRLTEELIRIRSSYEQGNQQCTEENR